MKTMKWSAPLAAAEGAPGVGASQFSRMSSWTLIGESGQCFCRLRFRSSRQRSAARMEGLNQPKMSRRARLRNSIDLSIRDMVARELAVNGQGEVAEAAPALVFSLEEGVGLLSGLGNEGDDLLEG